MLWTSHPHLCMPLECPPRWRILQDVFGDNDTELFSRLHPNISIVSFWMLAIQPLLLAAPNRVLDIQFVLYKFVSWPRCWTLEVWICRFIFVRSCFLRVFLLYLRIQILFFWWLRHWQIFPMRHSSDGRGYIWIVNSLLLSVHTTCHRRCQAQVAVTDVVWGFHPHHWNSKRHCSSLTMYPASKTYCTWFAHCAAPTSCLGHPVYTQSTVGRLSWSEAL